MEFVKNAHSVLASLSADWEMRVDAMKKIRDFCNSSMPLSEVNDIVAPLAKPLAVQVRKFKSGACTLLFFSFSFFCCFVLGFAASFGSLEGLEASSMLGIQI